MNYEAWRMTYQDSEQAARAAFKLVCELSSEVKELKNDKLAQDAAYNAMMAQRDAATEHIESIRSVINLDHSAARFSEICNIAENMTAQLVDTAPSEVERDIEQKVIDILTEQLGMKRGDVHSESTRDILGMDSLDDVEVIMAIEEAFDMCISDDDAEKLLSVRDTVKYIAGKQESMHG